MRIVVLALILLAQLAAADDVEVYILPSQPREIPYIPKPTQTPTAKEAEVERLMCDLPERNHDDDAKCAKYDREKKLREERKRNEKSI